jgi:hypothetical protein
MTLIYLQTILQACNLFPKTKFANQQVIWWQLANNSNICLRMVLLKESDVEEEIQKTKNK